MEPSFVPATALLCDFCNDPSVVRSYAAAPVVLKVDDIALFLRQQVGGMLDLFTVDRRKPLGRAFQPVLFSLGHMRMPAW